MRRRRQRWILGATAMVAAIAAVACYSGGPADVPTRHAGVTSPARRVRRLSNREYDNVVRDLLGDDSRRASKFVVDSYLNGYDNGSAGLAVQSDQVAFYQDAAEAIASNAVTSALHTLVAECDVAVSGEAACVDAFITGIAARAFRRPLASSEAERLRAAYRAELDADGGAADAAASTPERFVRGVQTMLEVVLQSPQFLYREELGPIDAVGEPGAVVALTDFEVASELSFLLTGSIPDAVLWSAVTEGRFTTADDRRREAARLLETPGAKNALRAFLHQWLATDRLASLTKDARVYPSFDRTTAASMSQELDLFYDDVLFAGDGSLRALFTSTRGFADGALAPIYGVDAPPAGQGMQPASLDPVLRKGVMSRAGFLAVHSATDSSGPIARGVFVLATVMCTPPARPPGNVPPAVPADDPSAKNLTTRERFDRHVSSPFCASCHRQIDGVGFGFEQFDGIGAFRTTDNGRPVDSGGTVVGAREIAGDYTGVSELSTKLAGSHLLAACFMKQAYRYAMGSVEPAADDVTAIAPTFDTDARVVDVLLAIIAHPIFVTRTFEPR